MKLSSSIKLYFPAVSILLVVIMICLFSGTVLAADKGAARQTRLLYGIGIITTFVLLDDFFTLHELFYPGFLHLNEFVVTAIYGISLAGCLFIYRDLVLRSEYLPLVLSFVFLALSVILDILSKNRYIYPGTGCMRTASSSWALSAGWATGPMLSFSFLNQDKKQGPLKNRQPPSKNR